MNIIKNSFGKIHLHNGDNYLVRIISINEMYVKCLYHTHRGWVPIEFHKYDIKEFIPIEHIYNNNMS